MEVWPLISCFIFFFGFFYGSSAENGMILEPVALARSGTSPGTAPTWWRALSGDVKTS